MLIRHDDVEAALVVTGGPRPPLSRAREDDLRNLIESRLMAQLAPAAAPQARATAGRPQLRSAARIARVAGLRFSV
jgi:hypothetical protein